MNHVPPSRRVASRLAYCAVLAAVGLAWVGIAGCSSDSAAADDQQLSAHRVRFLLGEQPGGAQDVLAYEESGQSGEVVLTGQIGGMPNPWSKNEAAFALADPALLAPHSHEGEDHECPFCATKAKGSKGMALVQFVGEDGQIIRIDARRLFDLSEKQTVVVRGQASRKDGLLVVQADGLYVPAAR